MKKFLEFEEHLSDIENKIENLKNSTQKDANILNKIYSTVVFLNHRFLEHHPVFLSHKIAPMTKCKKQAKERAMQ